MEQKQSISFFAYVFAILSFIPIIGVIFIISSLSYGIAKRRIGGYEILLIGLVGLILQIFLANYSFNKVFSADNTIFIQTSITKANENLYRAIKNIELYKKFKLKYPTNLEEVVNFNKELDKESFHLYENFLLISFYKGKPEKKIILLNYKLINTNMYTLYSNGIDLKENTDDDIYPTNNHIKSGYIDKRRIIHKN